MCCGPCEVHGLRGRYQKPREVAQAKSRVAWIRADEGPRDGASGTTVIAVERLHDRETREGVTLEWRFHRCTGEGEQ
jgi:hypothetical protein